MYEKIKEFIYVCFYLYYLYKYFWTVTVKVFYENTTFLYYL